MASNDLFFTQKSTGMPPIGQYFHFFWIKFGVKLSKGIFKFKNIFLRNQIWRNFTKWRPKWKKKFFCCQIVNFHEFQKLFLLKFAFTCGHICMLILNF
jgi:hypothetical protein